MKNKNVNNMMKNTLKSGVIAIICTLLLSSVTHAQFEQGGGGEGGQQLICRGDRDFATFMSAIVSYDGFVEYWEDILVRYNRNICHYQDIDSLLQRLTKVRKQLRSAFYACADTKKLKETYYELETMLYYLRAAVEYDPVTREYSIKEDQKVINGLKDFFVYNSDDFTKEKTIELFEKFKEKYGSRMDAYTNCQDGDWRLLIEKWNEFKESAGGIGPALKQAKESAEKKWTKLSKSAEGLSDMKIMDKFGANINGLPAEEGWAAIAEEFKENLPNGATFEQLRATQEQSAKSREYDEISIEYEEQYSTRYRETSDEFARLIENRLIKLNEIIQLTYPYQNQTIHCVKNIKNKQCP
jgi:uncharacterized protein YeeX (DUF496 family)